MNELIGKRISDYRILEKVGQGSMGIVYKAEDTKLKRTVAVKFLTPHALGSEEQKTRFIREAQAPAALNHSNICTAKTIPLSVLVMFISTGCMKMGMKRGGPMMEPMPSRSHNQVEEINTGQAIDQMIEEAV